MSKRPAVESAAIPNGVRDNGAVVPFLLGAAVGGVAGAVVGTLFSGHTAQLVGTLLDFVDRRGVPRDGARPKFEFLQQ